MTGATQAEKPRDTRFWIFLFLTFVLLCGSFKWNIFQIEKTQTADDLGVDSYIIPTMHFYAEGPRLRRDLGEIELFSWDGSHDSYVMQIGIQRIIYSLLSPNSKAGVDRAIPHLRSMIAVGLALTFVVFIAAVQMEFGYLCAGITALLLALSDWLIVFAPDLFWISATFFIPFVLALLLGDPSRPLKQRRLLAVLFTFFCLFKCFCGFDYTTNVFGAVAVPFIYYGLRRGVALRKIAMRIIGYGALSVVAFCSAIAFQILQYSFIQGNTASNSIPNFFKEARRRTASNGEGISNGYDRAVLSVLHRLHVPSSYDARLEHYIVPLRPVLRYFRYLGMGAITLPLPIHSLRIPIGLFIIGFITIFWIHRKHYRNSARGITDRVTAWMWATLAALFISHLWVVAANGHMTHTFFNAIVFYIPFLPMVYVLLGIAFASFIQRATGKAKKQEVVTS